MQVDAELDQDARMKAALEALDSLVNCSEEEAQEQRETGALLMKYLDEDRLSYRKLFSNEWSSSWTLDRSVWSRTQTSLQIRWSVHAGSLKW